MVTTISTTSQVPVTTQETQGINQNSLAYSLMVLLGVTLESGQNAQLDALAERADMLNTQLQSQLADLEALKDIPSSKITAQELAVKVQCQNNSISQTQQEVSTTLQVDLVTAQQQITISQNLAGKQLGFLEDQQSVLSKR